MKVIYTIGSIQLKSGGPSIMLSGLTRALAKLDVDITIICEKSDDLGGNVDLSPSVRLLEFNSKWPKQYSPNRLMYSSLLQELKSADLIHNFGMWRAINRYSGLASKYCLKPLVYSPQGMLEPEALGRSSIKKKIAFELWEKKNLELARCVHATGGKEIDSIINTFQSCTSTALIPNGVDLPDKCDISSRDELDINWPKLSGKKYFLYLGRIHPHKFPESLFSAWLKAGSDVSDHCLVFAGPDWNDHSKQIIDMAIAENLCDKIIFTGEVSGCIKNGLLANASALILPSKSESFGNVVIESLACGTPVIANRNAPWDVLETRKCGWWVNVGIDPLANALREVLKLTETERTVMGQRGRELVGDTFVWPTIAKEMHEVYRWILGEVDPPSSVRLY